MMLIYLLGMLVLYFVLKALFALLFDSRLTKFNLAEDTKNVFYIVSLFVFLLLSVSFINNPFWANRALHALLGAFMSYFVYLLAIKDKLKEFGYIKISLLGLLVVNFLGVLNEVAEFFAQEYIGILFAASITDTWLDLLSNLIGVIFASLFFSIFYLRKNAKRK